MKFINFDNYIEKNDNEYINKNCFVPQHPSNTVILVDVVKLDIVKPICCSIF